MIAGRFHVVLLAALAAVADVADVGLVSADERPDPIRLLWVGSSSIYYHNQPKVCAEWLTECCNTPAVSELVGKSGTGVHVYLRPGFAAQYGTAPGQTILEKIAGEKYDFVVLQVPAEFINWPEGEEHDRSIDVYCRAIRAAGGEPVIYEMGWGRDEKAEVGREKIFAAAARNRVTRFAPCSSAWERVRHERPGLDLQNPPDQAHPGTLGGYLNLCCFVVTLTEKRPKGLPDVLEIWRHLGDDEKAAANAKMERAELDTYDAALPSWMRRMAFTAETVRIDSQTARYLQDAAWGEYRVFQKRLVAAMEP
jgi:hypothetical protein